MNPIEIAFLPGKGRGYKATTDIAAGTVIHVSEPLSTTVSQEWIPETCMWCFNFSYPKKQKFKAMTLQQEKLLSDQWSIPTKKNIPSLFKDVLFCSESCRDAFKSHDVGCSILASNYRLDQAYKASANYEINVPLSDASPQEVNAVSWFDLNNDEALTVWLDDAWDCLTKDADLCKDIDDADRAMCRLIASCIARKNVNPEQYQELLVIQNNELAHFRSHYSNSTLYPDQLPLLKNSATKRQDILSLLPVQVLEVMALYSFFNSALTSILNKIPVLANVDHHLFRSIFFRERANSFGLWELGDHGVSLSDGGVTDDLELLGFGIYPSAVYFNHSCDANVVKVRQGRSMQFIARRMIEKDEEACISYGSIGEDVESRRQRLMAHYHFLCQCSRCLQEDLQNRSTIR